MAILVARQRLRLNRNASIATQRITLASQTESIALRIKRPTTLDTSAVFGEGSRLALRVAIRRDAEDFQIFGATTGGVRTDRRGVDIGEYVLSYTLPWGFFGSREGLPRRLGEGSTTFDVLLELLLGGDPIDTQWIVEANEATAVAVPFHSSVAFDAASSAQEVSGDGTITFSHTAAGSNRAAFLASGGESTGVMDAAATLTYAGNASTAAFSIFQLPFNSQANTARYVLEASVPTGAQTVSASFGESCNYQGAGCISLTGVDQTTPVGTPQTTNASTGTTPSVTVTGTTSDGVLCDSMSGFVQNGVNPTAGANQTKRWSLQQPSNSGFFVGSTQLASDGGVMSWSKDSNYEYSLGAIEFKAAAGGAAAAVPTLMLMGVGF